jgi:excisionase family DNA binding protein
MKKVVLDIHERAALSVEEVAAMLGVGRNTIYELIAADAIDSVKVGARRIIPVEAVKKYIDREIEEQCQHPREYPGTHRGSNSRRAASTGARSGR